MLVEIYLMNGRTLHSSTLYTFDRKYKYMKTYSYIYYEWFWEKCLIFCLRLSFLSTNSFGISAKFMLSIILEHMQSAKFMLSIILEHMQSVVSHSLPEVCFYALQSRKDAVTAFAACESKSKLIAIISLSLKVTSVTKR